MNNAGVLGYVADGEILPVRVYRNCLAVNFLAAVEVSQVFLPLLRHSRGRLVNVCSMAGNISGMFIGSCQNKRVRVDLEQSLASYTGYYPTYDTNAISKQVLLAKQFRSKYSWPRTPTTTQTAFIR